MGERKMSSQNVFFSFLPYSFPPFSFHNQMAYFLPPATDPKTGRRGGRPAECHAAPSGG